MILIFISIGSLNKQLPDYRGIISPRTGKVIARPDGAESCGIPGLAVLRGPVLLLDTRA